MIGPRRMFRGSDDGIFIFKSRTFLRGDAFAGVDQQVPASLLDEEIDRERQPADPDRADVGDAEGARARAFRRILGIGTE